MKEIPRMFQKEMVQKIQANLKSQTRRLDGLKGLNENPDKWKFLTNINDDWVYITKAGHTLETLRIKPRYKVGNVIWVKETYALRPEGYDDDSLIPEILYLADYEHWAGGGGWQQFVTWKPAIFMPKDVARIRLEITAFRIERLQKITGDEAVLEGIEQPQMVFGFGNIKTVCRINFRKLWDSINGKKMDWDFNPWVNVISFKKL